jgi:hypothetical protein
LFFGKPNAKYQVAGGLDQFWGFFGAGLLTREIPARDSAGNCAEIGGDMMVLSKLVLDPAPRDTVEVKMGCWVT